MATRTAVIQVEPDLAEALNAAPKTRKKQALSAMRQVLRPAGRRKGNVPRLSKKETELFLKINRTLPEDKQQRYDELNEKRFEETLKSCKISGLRGCRRSLISRSYERYRLAR